MPVGIYTITWVDNAINQSLSDQNHGHKSVYIPPIHPVPFNSHPNASHACSRDTYNKKIDKIKK